MGKKSNNYLRHLIVVAGLIKKANDRQFNL